MAEQLNQVYVSTMTIPLLKPCQFAKWQILGYSLPFFDSPLKCSALLSLYQPLAFPLWWAVYGLCLIFISFMEHTQDLRERRGQGRQTLHIAVPGRCSACRKAAGQEERWKGMEELSQGVLKARESLLPNPEHKLTRPLLAANRGVIKLQEPNSVHSPFQQWAACVRLQVVASNLDSFQPGGSDCGVLAKRAVLVRSVISQPLDCNVCLGQVTLPIYNKVSFIVGPFH